MLSDSLGTWRCPLAFRSRACMVIFGKIVGLYYVIAEDDHLVLNVQWVGQFIESLCTTQ